MSPDIRILHLAQDDPRKCTAQRLAQQGLATLYPTLRGLPPQGVVLDPFAERELSRRDALLIEVGGLVAVDCSWARARQVFGRLRLRGLELRRLPPLVPTNPVNAGKTGKLTTAEALAGALALTGATAQAEALMATLKWGPSFLALNKTALR